VAEYAQSRGHHFVPVSVCYRSAQQYSREVLSLIGHSVEEVIFCGSSMGGWFARIMQLLFNRDRPGLKSAAIAFNPAFDLSMYGYMLVGPQVNYITQEEYQWTRDHSEQLRSLESSVNYRAELPFFVYVDKNDEVIDWKKSAARHSPISRFIAFEGGCHSFDHFHEALADFDTAFKGAENRDSIE
jgi:predicted esterase YcpF (UPF0227 family)